MWEYFNLGQSLNYIADTMLVYKHAYYSVLLPSIISGPLELLLFMNNFIGS